ncbi:MAG: copper resistance protein NlpE N-terminal domain-containing protein [Solitalea sp.]
MSSLTKFTILAFLLTACGSLGRKSGAELVFEGTIPCADCPGIIMQIRLDTVERTYIRHMTYLEAENGKDLEFSNSGSYTTEQGYKEDRDALLYVLNDPPSGSEQVFLASGDTAIVALDGNREIIQSQLNFTLKKKE